MKKIIIVLGIMLSLSSCCDVNHNITKEKISDYEMSCERVNKTSSMDYSICKCENIDTVCYMSHGGGKVMNCKFK